MRAAAIFRSFAAGTRRGLALMAALAFIVSGMSSVHTAHAMAGEHHMPSVKPAVHAQADGHCGAHEQQAPETKQDGAFSCCAFACAPAIALPAVPQMLGISLATSSYVAPPQQTVLQRQIDGLFRPPRQHA